MELQRQRQCECEKCGGSVQREVRRPGPGWRLYMNLYPERRVFYASAMAKIEQLERLVEDGTIAVNADGSPAPGCNLQILCERLVQLGFSEAIVRHWDQGLRRILQGRTFECRAYFSQVRAATL